MIEFAARSLHDRLFLTPFSVHTESYDPKKTLAERGFVFTKRIGEEMDGEAFGEYLGLCVNANAELIEHAFGNGIKLRRLQTHSLNTAVGRKEYLAEMPSGYLLLRKGNLRNTMFGLDPNLRRKLRKYNKQTNKQKPRNRPKR